MSRSSDDPWRKGPAAPTQRQQPQRGPALPARMKPSDFDEPVTGSPGEPGQPIPFDFERATEPGRLVAQPDFDRAYQEVMTGPASPAQRLAPEAPKPVPRRAPAPRIEVPADIRAPADGRSARGNRGAPIVPPGSVTGRSLMLVIVIMCFFACLTAGAVYMMNQSAAAWLRDIGSEITVQVEARERVDVDRQVVAVAKWLEQQRGIRAARPLSAGENAKLTEAWLGDGAVLKELPIPRLIAVEVDSGALPDIDALRAGLAQTHKGVTLDDHRHWRAQIRTVTRSFALGGLAILMLVGAATTAIIVSATRSALSANREIVEVLHFVGASDRFIAREFEKHFLWLGIKAGLLGALAATVAFLALPFGMEVLGGGTVTIAELRRLVGTATLDLPGHLLLGVVVIVVAALCMLTSRMGVYRILNAQQ